VWTQEPFRTWWKVKHPNALLWNRTPAIQEVQLSLCSQLSDSWQQCSVFFFHRTFSGTLKQTYNNEFCYTEGRG
jgi:hypothetical protein